MNDLTALERDVMQMLLNGDDPVLAILREQLRVATVSERKMTGVGFHTHFSVPPTTSRVLENPSFEIGDIAAQVQGVQHGAGFLLFVRDGFLSFLEGFTYDEPWPEQITKYELAYINGRRDWNELRKKLHGNSR
jgi:hypothetical protein